MAKSFSVGFFGAGKMAEGILSAMVSAPDFDPSRIIMAEKNPKRAAEIADKYRVAVVGDLAEVAKKAPMIFLAVRPQDVPDVALKVKGLFSARKLLVSIVAGKSTATLRKCFGSEVRVVRVMPNLCLRAGEGMCAVSPAANATKGDVAKTVKLLSLAGRAIVLAERHLDAVTALSGSGPAFFAAMERAMMKGGRALGLPLESARMLAEQTMLGTAAFLRKSNMDLDEFISGVATPGGTTAAGIDILSASDFDDVVKHTLAAAASRSTELGKMK